jgi:RNase P/RNase MRP subunit POP5
MKKDYIWSAAVCFLGEAKTSWADLILLALYPEASRGSLECRWLGHHVGSPARELQHWGS